MSIVFTANTVRPCKELRGAPVQVTRQKLRYNQYEQVITDGDNLPLLSGSMGWEPRRVGAIRVWEWEQGKSERWEF